MVNAKKKGNRGENLFAQWLTSQGFPCYRNSGSGCGIQKSDAHNSLDINFEIKTVKRINLQEAWRQTTRDASMTHTSPMLAIHFDGMPENEWLMVLHSEDWIDMFKKSQGEKIIETVPEEDSREKKWAIQNMLNALKKLEKFY